MNDGITLQGKVTLQLYGPDGQLKQEVTKQNMICNSARALIIDLLQKAVVDKMAYVAIGTGTLPAAASDTVLQTQTAYNTGTETQEDGGYTDRLVATFASGSGTGAITEVARQAATASGPLARTVLTGGDIVNKGSGDSLVVTYNISYASSA